MSVLKDLKRPLPDPTVANWELFIRYCNSLQILTTVSGSSTILSYGAKSTSLVTGNAPTTYQALSNLFAPLVLLPSGYFYPDKNLFLARA